MEALRRYDTSQYQRPQRRGGPYFLSNIRIRMREKLRSHLPDALFQHVDRCIRFVLGHYQWRADTNRARAAAQEEHSVLERPLDDAVALCVAVLFGDLVLDDLNPNHQA